MAYLNRLVLAAAVFGTAASAAPFTVRYESAAPGMQATSASFSLGGVETFDSRPTGVASFTTDFGTGGRITGRYSDVQIASADQFGGAGGDSNYAVSFGEYTLDLTTTAAHGATFFGYWLSALDGGNAVTFYGGGRKLFTFASSDALAAVAASPDRGAYYGNPNPAFATQNGGEPYIFLSFFSNARSFDRVVFTEVGSGGYESDNHTVGRYTGVGTGTVVPLLASATAAVPEPASWALMLAGFGAVGLAARRRGSLVPTMGAGAT